MGLFRLFNSKHSLIDSGVLKGSTDRHSHILYGVDDGIKTLEDSLAVLAFEESLGVKEVWCTPHIMEDVPNTTQSLRNRFEELCSQYNGTIKLRLAAEYMLDTVFIDRFKANDLLLMQNDTILVETSTIVPPYDLVGMLGQIMSDGLTALLAHPERYRFLEIDDILQMRENGVALQLNIASVTGYYGKSVRTKAEALLAKGAYSVFGSDCHRLMSLMEQYSRPELTKKTINNLNLI
ncbi:MAG: capsular biosynthesis protein [Bacteroidales bacterium]|nr:capsular biosynthesis protein [Bacteroidales bacterium]